MTQAEKWALIEAEELTPDVREIFDAIVADGNTPQFAMMCIHQQSPKMDCSDRAFNESRRRHMSGMKEKHRDEIVAIAKRAGIDTDGKYYVGGLGRYNDPAAWVSTHDDVKQVCQKKNLNSTGLVKHKAAEAPPPKRVKLAEDLVQQQSRRMLASDPALAEKVRKGKVKKQEIRERVIAKHGSKRND